LEAFWLREADALELGKRTDQVIRQAELDEAQARKITACVETQHLEPAAQRVLSSRFGTVQSGMDAATFWQTYTGCRALEEVQA
jgi:hypothetical protein